MADSLAKRLELGFRHWLLRHWNGAAPLVVERPMPLLQPTEATPLLLLRQDRIGDLLVSIPLLRILHTRFPTAPKELLLGANNWGARHVAQRYIQRVWRYDKHPLALARLLRQLRNRYTIVIDLTDNPSVTSSLLLTLLRAPIRVGIAKGNDAAYTHVVPLLDRGRFHIVERIAQLLLPFGIQPEAPELFLEYPITAAERQWARQIVGDPTGSPRIGVNISASSASKYWGRNRWIAFLRELRRRYPEAEILLFASPSDAQEHSAIASATGVRAVPIMPSFHQFAVLLEQCDIIVTPDTAAVHLAAAWKRPCLGLYVWDQPTLLPWFPYGTLYEAAFTRAPALSHLPVEAALDAFERLLHRLQEENP